MSGRCLAVSNTVWIVSELRERDSEQFSLFQFLNSTPGSQDSPIKNTEFWGVWGVSGECLGGVWRVSEGFCILPRMY